MNLIGTPSRYQPYSLEDAFQAKECTTEAMNQAINEWFSLYFQQQATEEEDPCQRIAYAVVNKITRTVFGEYSAIGANAFVQSVLDGLNQVRNKAMQMALVGGCCLLKPAPFADGWRWEVIRRDRMLIFGRVGERLNDVGLVERAAWKEHYYTLLERRTVDRNGYLTIRNMLYRSGNANELGTPCALKELPQYERLLPEYTFSVPIHSIGAVVLQTPIDNSVDGSEEPVAVFAAATGLIHNINRNEAQLNGEFDRGESRIITSADMLRTKVNRANGMEYWQLRDHVFVGLDEDPETTGITIFSPALREASFLARKQEYLRNVESVIGLKRGLLSEVEAVERTAKEITSSEGDYSLTIIDFQRMWETGVKEAVQLCGVLGNVYRVPGASSVTEDAVTLDFGNGILYDRDKTGQEMMAQVSAGLLQPERYLGWYYGLPADTEAQRAKIRKEYMPQVEELEDGE